MLLLHLKYIQSIDGSGREDLFYGYITDNVETPLEENEQMLGFFAIGKPAGKPTKPNG
jgi:hypothetical protein